jgi:hypothetical protein
MNDSVRTRVILILKRPNTDVAWPDTFTITGRHGGLGGKNPSLLDQMEYESEDKLTLTKIRVYRGEYAEGEGLTEEQTELSNLVKAYEDANNITTEKIVEYI